MTEADPDLDFGAESARAVLVDLPGREVMKFNGMVLMTLVANGAKTSCPEDKSILLCRSWMTCGSYSSANDSPIVPGSCANWPVYSGFYGV
jgi:ribulose kinase